MKQFFRNRHQSAFLLALLMLPLSTSSVTGQSGATTPAVPSGTKSSALSGTKLPVTVSGAKPASAAAWALYGANKFAESSDVFETVLKTSAPSARLYYQAAIANYSANRRGRARQLCTYVVQNFRSTQEAAQCTRLFPELAQAAAAPVAATARGPELLDENNLPVNFFDKMEPSVRERLKTPQGKVALKAAVADYNKRALAAAAKNAESAGASQMVIVSKGGSLRTKTSPFPPDAALKRGDHPFSAAQVARDGAKGIDQGANPNCWFEASMAALAELPRGQRLLASMITYGGNGMYVVRFPGDGEEYKIDEQTLDRHGVRDTAQWASLSPARKS